MSWEYFMVPVQVDALCLPQDRQVSAPFTDFSKLPWTDGSRDYNSSQPFISENLVDRPFADQHLRLKKGIHLHWALPDALTKTIVDAGGNASQPAVPDRWLVVRLEANTVSGQWMVESNYLFPAGPGQDTGRGTGAVSMPGNFDPGAQAPTFRYMGRKYSLDAYDPDEQGDYLDGLTALGYGEPAFAAFYPNCSSVFGFHDGSYGDTLPDQLKYVVLGYYSDSNQDALAQYTQNLPEGCRFEEWLDGLTLKFGWTTDDPAPTTLPDTILCYGEVLFQTTSVSAPSPQSLATDTQIALGNTGTEAISALLASQLQSAYGGDVKNLLEDQLEAVQILDFLNSLKLDIGASFYESRHTKGFSATQAGTLWSIRSALPEGANNAEAGQQAENVDLPSRTGGRPEPSERDAGAL